MIWLMNNLVNIIVIALVLGLIGLCIRSLVKRKRSGLPACACGKSCAGCSGCAICASGACTAQRH